MTDDEIIKALECCKELMCKDCPTFPNSTPVLLCKSRLEIEALDLIKRQQSEIEKWKEAYDGLDRIAKEFRY